MSLFIRGICKGIRTQDRANKQTGESYKDFFLGVEVRKKGGFGEETETVSVRFSKAQIDAALPAIYSKLVGKDLMCPVWVRPWHSATKGSVGYELFLSDDGKPVVVPAAQ